MSEEKNELKAYIEASIDEKFEREAVIRKTEASRVYLYRHKESGKRIIQRHSKTEMMMFTEFCATSDFAACRRFTKFALTMIGSWFWRNT